MNSVAIYPTVLTLGATGVALWCSRRLWKVVDTPTLPTGHVVIGQCEVHGRAGLAPGAPLVHSPLQGQPCVWWKAELQQEVGSGKNRSWKTRSSAESFPAITVDDGSGPVIVDLRNADRSRVHSDTTDTDDIAGNLTADDLALVARAQQVSSLAADDRTFFERLVQQFEPHVPMRCLNGKWRVREEWFAPGDDMYVLGATAYDETMRAAVFRHRDGAGLLAYRGTEAEITFRTRLVMIAAAVAAVALSWWWFAVLRGVDYTDRRNKAAVHLDWQKGRIGPLLLLAIGLLAQLVRARNRVVAVSEQHRSAQGLVDIALKKRATLVPQLVTVVEAAAAHEQTLLPLVGALRADAGPIPAQLLATAEASPTLRTNANYLALQRQLTDVEDDLATARGFQSDAAAIARTRAQSFPDGLVARLTGVRIG